MHRHDLAAIRSGIDVAVLAGQVAESPKIDLEHVDRYGLQVTAQFGEPRLFEWVGMR